MKRTLSVMAVAVASQYLPIDAFVPTAPTTSNRVAAPVPRSCLMVVADPPNIEDEKRSNGKGKKDDDDDWVEAKGGGFLPKIPRVFREKLGGSGSRQRRPSGKPEEVLTIQEYKAVVAEEKDQMVCVRFYAPWCKACKAVEQPFRKLCRENPSVKFVEVPLTKENAFLHDGLGVPSLPYGHIYHPAVGLVEEHKINLKRREFADFEQILNTYVQGTCLVEYSDDGSTCQQAKKTSSSTSASP